MIAARELGRAAAEAARLPGAWAVIAFALLLAAVSCDARADTIRPAPTGAEDALAADIARLNESLHPSLAVTVCHRARGPRVCFTLHDLAARVMVLGSIEIEQALADELRRKAGLAQSITGPLRPGRKPAHLAPGS